MNITVQYRSHQQPIKRQQK